MQTSASALPIAPRLTCAGVPTPLHPPGSRSSVAWASSSIEPIDPFMTAADRCASSDRRLRSPGQWPVTLAAGAVPPPPLGPLSCPMCLGPTWRPGRRCWPCVVADRALGATCPPLVTVAAYRAGSTLHAALRGYKDGDHAPARARWTDALAALLTGVAVTHQPCLTALVGPVDALCVVPSHHHRAGDGAEATLVGDRGAPISGQLGTGPSGCDACEHHAPRRTPSSAQPHRDGPRCFEPSDAEPLHALLDRVPAWTTLRRVRLEPGSGTVDHLRPAPDAFSCDERLDGCRVLVVDDTWTTGAQARSAAAAVTGAGGHVVGIVAVGRFVAPHASVSTAAWWRWATACALARGPGRVGDPSRPMPGSDGGCRSAQVSLDGVSGDPAPDHLVADAPTFHWDQHHGRRGDPPCPDPRCPVQLPGRRRPVSTGAEDPVRPSAARARSRPAAPDRDRRP
jgi:hypothetical protein